MATFSKDQIDNLANYLRSKYETLAETRLNQEKEAIKKSDEYKEQYSALYHLMTSFITNKDQKSSIENEIRCILRMKYPILRQGTWDFDRNIRIKIEAILSTIVETSFEEVEKIVDEKLDFEEIYDKYIINYNQNSSNYEFSMDDEVEF